MTTVASVKTAIIVPTYNEVDNLALLAPALLALPLPVEVIVVDDNSPDGTGRLAEGLAAADGRVVPLHRPAKLGLGTAYVAGFRAALARGADRIVTMDADFSHHPRYVPYVVALTQRVDLGIGSRYVRGGGTSNWGPERQLLSSGANTLARAALGLPAHDCTAGFRCYRRAVLETIDLDGIRSNGYSFLIEMLYRVVEAGFTVAETPIIFENRRHGKSKISEREIAKAGVTVARLARRRSASSIARRWNGSRVACQDR
ncbi:MAG: polyprenol monophosphomannose synthase [Anaerolineae bacterium]